MGLPSDSTPSQSRAPKQSTSRSQTPPRKPFGSATSCPTQTTPKPHSQSFREDNRGAQALAENQRSLGRTKRIDTRYHFIRQYINSGTLLVKPVPTAEQTADIFTKALPQVSFYKHRESLRVFAPANQ
jgi:hypothetical protein